MTSKKIADAAIKILNQKITNEIFLIIQNDRELMHNYLRVNQTIGKEVKKAYKLKNLNDREDNPTCTLIQSHQKFE